MPVPLLKYEGTLGGGATVDGGSAEPTRLLSKVGQLMALLAQLPWLLSHITCSTRSDNAMCNNDSMSTVTLSGLVADVASAAAAALDGEEAVAAVVLAADV